MIHSRRKVSGGYLKINWWFFESIGGFGTMTARPPLLLNFGPRTKIEFFNVANEFEHNKNYSIEEIFLVIKL